MNLRDVIEKMKGGHLYTTLCQNARCHSPLGALHFGGSGGIVVQICQRCGSVSAFKNGPYGIESEVVGHVKQGLAQQPLASAPKRE